MGDYGWGGEPSVVGMSPVMARSKTENKGIEGEEKKNMNR